MTYHTITCADTSALTYSSPFERGVITDWDSQGAVLHRLASQLDTPLAGSHFTSTLPVLTPDRQQELAWESIFEAHSVASAAFLPPPLVAALLAEGVPVPDTLPEGARPNRVQGGFTGIIVDASHSGITATPVILGVPHISAVKRTNAGGKAVANALARSVSKRQVDLLSTPLAVRRMLQALCFVHPTGGAPLLQDAAAADVCAAAGAGAAVKSAYLRHVAPGRKGVCSELEAVTWASACVRDAVSSAHIRGPSTSTQGGATAPAAKKPRSAASSPVPTSTCTAYGGRNKLVNCVPDELRSLAWLSRLKGGGEELTAFDALVRQQSVAQCVLEEDLQGDTQWSLQSTASRHPFLDDGCGLGIVREWVLPDKVAVQQGFVRGGEHDPFMTYRATQLDGDWPGVRALQPEQADAEPEHEGEGDVSAVPSDDGLAHVVLGSERFLPCEMLFRPDSVGVFQGGAAATVAAAALTSPAEWQPALWGNVAVVGGLACLPGMVARLRREVRALAPADAAVGVWRVPAPDTACMRGLMWLAAQPVRQHIAVSRETYDELGASRVAEAASQVWLTHGAPLLGATGQLSVDGGVSAAAALLAAATAE